MTSLPSFYFLLQRKKSAQFLFVHSLVFPPKENEVRMWVDGEAEKTMEMEEMALSQSEEQLATSPPGSAISRAGWRPWQLITKAPRTQCQVLYLCAPAWASWLQPFPPKPSHLLFSIPLILLSVCLCARLFVGLGGETWVRPQGRCLMSER